MQKQIISLHFCSSSMLMIWNKQNRFLMLMWWKEDKQKGHFCASFLAIESTQWDIESQVFSLVLPLPPNLLPNILPHSYFACRRLFGNLHTTWHDSGSCDCSQVQRGNDLVVIFSQQDPVLAYLLLHTNLLTSTHCSSAILWLLYLQ